MSKVFHTATRSQMDEWVQRMVSIEQELHHAGMHVTARDVNKAVKAIGWEFSGDVTTAAQAAEGTP